ncbi:riboflavin synthase [Candidatus Bipolaricaulota bacterium]|nr:riboflavin synthase [Candidatus Bipolaricaulota bacterium]
MFTGIVDHLGKFVRSNGSRYYFSLPEDYLHELEVGGSVAVNGVCLTAVEIDEGRMTFSADVSEETRRRTDVGMLRPGDRVNLELPLTTGGLSDRLGGHIVQGHVDTMGEIARVRRRRKNYEFRLVTSSKYSKFLVEKGAIAVDGISLTPYEIRGGSFLISVIPHTYDNTTLQFSRGGSRVNLEFDILGKYVINSVESG